MVIVNLSMMTSQDVYQQGLYRNMEGEIDLNAFANMSNSDAFLIIFMLVYMFGSFYLSYFVAHMMEVVGFLEVPAFRLTKQKN